jgi:UDP-glucuronate decarboxylase
MATVAELTGPVNIRNPDEFTMLELAQKIIKLTGSQSTLIFQPLPSDDPCQSQPDIKLDEGLVKTIEYFKTLFHQRRSI